MKRIKCLGGKFKIMTTPQRGIPGLRLFLYLIFKYNILDIAGSPLEAKNPILRTIK